MEDELRQIYYDPSLGLRSAEGLYRRAKEEMEQLEGRRTRYAGKK